MRRSVRAITSKPKLQVGREGPFFARETTVCATDASSRPGIFACSTEISSG